MFTPVRKMFLASILILIVSLSGAWQGDHVVLAESRTASMPEIPLYAGLTWKDLGTTTQDVKINIKGDVISLPGKRYEAVEPFVSGLPQAVSDYYSNGQLAQAGWVSYDTFDKSGGMYHVFQHKSGTYLSVEFLKCPDAQSGICVAVWMSEPVEPASFTQVKTAEPEDLATIAATFGKKTPAKGATNLNPTSLVLSWQAYVPTPDKYSYCVKEGSACAANDPDWTSTFNTSVTLSNLTYDKTYYWQVRAVTCVTCVPKTFVYADNDTAWTFKTKLNTQSVIIGNAGVARAVLSYTDGVLKTVTANGSGNYSITVPYGWSGRSRLPRQAMCSCRKLPASATSQPFKPFRIS